MYTKVYPKVYLKFYQKGVFLLCDFSIFRHLKERPKVYQMVYPNVYQRYKV